MAIESFDPANLIDYVPAYAGNRGSDDPCVVSLKFVPYARVQHYARLIAARQRNAADPVKLTEVSQEIQKKQFVESVDKVSGFFIEGREVTEANEFYETADTELIIEIIQAMESQQKLTEGQRKN